MGRLLDGARCNQLHSDTVKIMTKASALIHGEPSATVEIRRGMLVICAEGSAAGRVAGVAVSQDDPQARCLILGHLPLEVGYQSLPVSWIERVEGDLVFLSVPCEMIQALAGWNYP